MKGFKDGHLMSFKDQIPGHRQTGGTGTDHGHSFAGGGGLFREFEFPLGPLPIGSKAFQPADGHRFFLLAQDAQGLALALLGTDPAADGRQTGLFPELHDGPGKISLFDMSYKTRDIDLDRTAFYTSRFLALQTSAGL